MSDGWIITTAFDTFSLFNIIVKYAVSSGLLLKTCMGSKNNQCTEKCDFA
jgi:hypothetical protein